MDFRRFDPKDGGAGGGAAAAVLDDKKVGDKGAAGDGGAGGGDKSGAGDGGAKPEVYELKLPENSSLEAADLDSIAKYAKDNGLTKVQAEALLKGRNDEAAAAQVHYVNETKKQVGLWETELQTDKTLGATFDDTKRIAAAGFDALFPKKTDEKGQVVEDDIRKFLKTSGLGSHPDVVRAFYKVGLKAVEDKHLQGGDKGGAAKTAAQKMYPNNP